MSTPVLLRLDDDDPCIGDYAAIHYPPRWETVISGRVLLSEVYNEGFDRHLDWYGIFADDVAPKTPGWDHLLIDAASLGGLAFGDDTINGGTHATHFVLGGDLVREMGWLALPGLARIYIDTVWNDIARQRGVFRYLPEVKIPHLHFSNRRALMDKTYRKSRKTEDRALYQAWRNRKDDE